MPTKSTHPPFGFRIDTVTPVYDEADLYCAAFDFPVDSEVDWLLRRFPEVKSVLEPMCGNARYGRAFTSRAIRYVGFDRSRAMLGRAATREGMTLHEADACDFKLNDGPFDLAYCPIDSIRHLAGDGDIERHLACVHRHLSENGRYVVEVDLMDRDGPNTQPADDKSSWSIEQPDGSVIVAEVRAERFDRATRCMWERSIYRRVDGATGGVLREANELHTMRQISWADLEQCASAAGFEIEAVHAHLSGNRRPRIDAPGPRLENTGTNHYITLRPTAP